MRPGVIRLSTGTRWPSSLGDSVIVSTGEGKGMDSTRRLFVTVAEAAVLFTLASWAFVLMTLAFRPHVPFRGETTAMLATVFVPDSLAAWWLYRRVRANRSRADTRRAATAFAVSAPLILGVGYLLGELVGGYAEVILGSRFILPAVASFIIVLMIFGPSAVVLWVLHPSGGVGAVPESDQNEHC